MDPLYNEGSPEVVAGEGDPTSRCSTSRDRAAWLRCIYRTMRLLDRRWLPAILVTLDDGPCRHGELLHRLGGVSKKVLSDTLASMSDGGLIDSVMVRDSWGESAAHYRITDLGRSALVLFAPVAEWGAHLDDVRAEPRPDR